MDGFDLLIINGLVVTASDTASYDIAIKDGKIALLAPPGLLGEKNAKRVIDAEGGYVMVWSSIYLFTMFNPHLLTGSCHSLVVSIAMSTSKNQHCSEEREGARTTSRQVSSISNTRDRVTKLTASRNKK